MVKAVRKNQLLEFVGCLPREGSLFHVKDLGDARVIRHDDESKIVIEWCKPITFSDYVAHSETYIWKILGEEPEPLLAWSV